MLFYKSHILTAAATLTLSIQAPAANSELRTEKYNGTAETNGKVMYTEHHIATFDSDNKIRSAKTEYKDASGKLVGVMESDFTQLVTAPVYSFKDLRNESVHGIRITDDNFVLFSKDINEKEKTKTIRRDFSPESLIVGCQGLHYYLRENFETVRGKKNIPLKFLIPGKLDYYSFLMNYVGESADGVITLEVKISSVFLRIFASKLVIQYDKKNKRLIRYDGLSNITDEKGSLQNVKITYTYDS